MAKVVTHKPFKNWLYEDVMNEFMLIRLDNHPFLEHLKKIKLADNDLHRPVIESMKSMLLDYVDSWNNDEHKLMFVGPFFNQATFISPHFKLFAHRKLSVKYEQGTKTTEGLVELMLAKGVQKPRKPFNFSYNITRLKNETTTHLVNY